MSLSIQIFTEAIRERLLKGSDFDSAFAQCFSSGQFPFFPHEEEPIRNKVGKALGIPSSNAAPPD